MLEVKYNKGN